MIALKDNVKERAERLLETPLRVFYHPSFDDPKLKKEILSEMPRLDKFQADLFKLDKLRSAKISAEMRPCYELPLLDHEQEQHLFRKMNYFKYQAKKLLGSINCVRVSEKKISTIETYLFKATSIRNKIAESNFRLATQLLKQKINLYQQYGLTDSLLSDAYLDVLKAVDYFNWTRGVRFSTYATWVLKNNFFRDSKQKFQHYERFTHLDDVHAESISSRGVETEHLHLDQQRNCMVSKLISMMDCDLSNKDRKRQVLVLEHYFGINVQQSHTLEQIAKKIGVSKERVRQLKEKGLSWMKNKIQQLGIQFDDYELEI